ncbi:MAG: sugar porter family MFS transporter [Prevotella sp.]|nr:sugar porter family MFS transporter [Prevotella sp.]
MKRTFVYFICMVAALGGLLFGYDWVVIGGAKPFYEAYFGIADSAGDQGLAMTTALIGCMLGAMVCGSLADRMGRRKLLMVAAIVFILSAYATGAADGFGAFLVARLFGGVGIGLASGLSPMYIAEVAPADIRGRMVSLNQMMIVLGILAAQVINWLIADPMPAGITTEAIAQSWNGQSGWRWMFWMPVFPAAAFLILAFFIPESPRWIAMRAAGTKQAGPSSGPGLRQLFSRQYARLLGLGLFIAVFQQWCGTNVIFNYAQEVFHSAGYEIGDVLFNIVVTGIANVVFTVIAIYTVDRLGRKPLMLIGAGGLSLIYAVLGCCYFLHVTGVGMILLVVAAIACYAMTLGPVTWVLISEIFPDRIRGVAVATCTFALWVGSSTLTYTFPFLNRALGSYGTFWIYSAVCAVGFVFFKYGLRETKGQDLGKA